MVKPRKIILIRHAESQSNRDKTVNRYIPNHRITLTENGLEQAKEAGRKLRDTLEPTDSVMFITSPYIRTRQTTDALIEAIDDYVPYKVYEEPRIREQDFGNFQDHETEMARIWQERSEYGHFFYRIPNGESAADVYDRVAGFLETLFRQFSEDSFPSILVLVTHGLLTRVFLMKWYRWKVEMFESLKNIRHCEFIVMDKQETGKYLLLNRLERWKEPEPEISIYPYQSRFSGSSTELDIVKDSPADRLIYISRAATPSGSGVNGAPSGKSGSIGAAELTRRLSGTSLSRNNSHSLSPASTIPTKEVPRARHSEGDEENSDKENSGHNHHHHHHHHIVPIMPDMELHELSREVTLGSLDDDTYDLNQISGRAGSSKRVSGAPSRSLSIYSSPSLEPQDDDRCQQDDDENRLKPEELEEMLNDEDSGGLNRPRADKKTGSYILK